MLVLRLALVGVALGAAMSAAQPAENAGARLRESEPEVDARGTAPGARYRGLPRRIDGGPGYVGSDWGLGKPSRTGLGSRPDWGRSSVD